MKTAEIFIQSLKIRDQLKAHNDFAENPIDDSLLPVLPFRVSNKIKLVIIGQDPTVKNRKGRASIEYALNLDKPGALKRYIQQICNWLSIDFENVYATNIFKYFYSIPPARTFPVLQNHLAKNLELLSAEIADYAKIPIITLGLPVLQLLARKDAQVSYYWDYNKKTKTTDANFKCCSEKENKLGRDFYPLPHQPSIIKKFYMTTLEDYLRFAKATNKKDKQIKPTTCV